MTGLEFVVEMKWIIVLTMLVIWGNFAVTKKVNEVLEGDDEKLEAFVEEAFTKANAKGCPCKCRNFDPVNETGNGKQGVA